MFKNDNNTETVESVDTIIGPSVSVEGNFKGDGNIIIEGTVKGSIKTKGFIKASENSIITANVVAESAEIAGEVIGNIKIKNNLEIKDKAIIQGDIETETLSVSRGAILNGTLKMKVGEKIEPDKFKKNEEDINNK